MKRKLFHAIALALAVVLAVGPAASASQALGTEIHESTIHLAKGVDYTLRYLWSATYSDLRTERYLEYTPNTVVRPAVSYGSTVLNRNTLSSLAQTLEGQGKRVLGGVNGDYYVLATGAPLGLVVTDGVVRSSSSYVYALGFDADGNAFIGQPYLSITAAFGDSSINIAGGLNKVRNDGEYILYSSDFNPNTYHSSAGVDVVLVPQNIELEGYTTEPVIGKRISCTVEDVLESTGSIEIPKGKLVLSINNNSDEAMIQTLAALQAGDTVELSFACADSRWASAVTVIGGLYKLVTDGVAESGLDTTQNPRTAVGIRADGSVIFYTIDGRQSGVSVGASMTQVAQRLVELGCVEGLCLDGGGSTTFGATLPGQDGFGVLNSPSDGSLRSVTNALFLVAHQAPAGPEESLLLSPGNAMVMPGTTLNLSAQGVDAIGQIVQSYAGSELEFDGGGAGTIENGVLTAGTQAGTFTVTASAGGVSGTAQITVVTTPDSFTVQNAATGEAVTSLSLRTQETIDLNAVGAVFRNFPLKSTDESFTWSVSGSLGTISPSGVLTTSAKTGGTGAVTVTAGSKTVSIPLTVTGDIYTVEDFEDGFQGGADGGVRMEPEKSPAYVRYGSQSARLAYHIEDMESAKADVSMTFRQEETYLSLWVYGDGSGNTLAASIADADGQVYDTILAVLNFTGWQRIITPLPDGALEIQTLKIKLTGLSSAGTIWLDQITSAHQYLTDDTPPTVTVTLSGNAVSAALRDNVDRHFSEEQISVTCDGQDVEFTLNGSTVAAALPDPDGKAHRVTVTAVDASGNIGRGSADIAESDQEEPFLDTAGHWAHGYIDYLYDQGIANGVDTGAGFQFQPDQNITRGEFALMTARWLRLDLTQYSDMVLPFADTASVPDWCLDGVKAMYALGIMTGSEENGGIYAHADSAITRAEAMTMLGRIQQKGYAVAELAFTDAAAVPAWAADYVKTLTAQGVVSGYTDGSIQPNATITRGEIAKVLYSMR